MARALRDITSCVPTRDAPSRARRLLAIAIAGTWISCRRARSGGPLPPLFPPSNWWNLDVSAAPVDPASAAYISFIGVDATACIHDLGGTCPPAASRTTASLRRRRWHLDETRGAVPIRRRERRRRSHDGDEHPVLSHPGRSHHAGALDRRRRSGERRPRNSEDRHLLIVDRDNQLSVRALQRLLRRQSMARRVWRRSSICDRTRAAAEWLDVRRRGGACHSAGTDPHDEAFGTAENHARVPGDGARDATASCYPASHRAGSTSGALPMGARLRLKASREPNVGCSTPEVQRIFRAMQRYGLIVADNGSDMYVSGTYDTRWNNGVLNPAFSALLGVGLRSDLTRIPAPPPSAHQPANQVARIAQQAAPNRSQPSSAARDPPVLSVKRGFLLMCRSHFSSSSARTQAAIETALCTAVRRRQGRVDIRARTKRDRETLCHLVKRARPQDFRGKLGSICSSHTMALVGLQRSSPRQTVNPAVFTQSRWPLRSDRRLSRGAALARRVGGAGVDIAQIGPRQRC